MEPGKEQEGAWWNPRPFLPVLDAPAQIIAVAVPCWSIAAARVYNKETYNIQTPTPGCSVVYTNATIWLHKILVWIGLSGWNLPVVSLFSSASSISFSPYLYPISCIYPSATNEGRKFTYKHIYSHTNIQRCPKKKASTWMKLFIHRGIFMIQSGKSWFPCNSCYSKPIIW